MPKKISYLGEFEQLVLLAVLRLDGDAYGMTIRQTLQTIANRPSSLGSVYTTLDRLEDKGLLTSLVGKPLAERGGRARKFFKITGAGAQALKFALKSAESMKAGLEPLLEK
jgi:PadR family transcriptional regulator PadR